MPSQLWFQKFSKFSKLAPSERQAFIVSGIVDRFLPEQINERIEKYDLSIDPDEKQVLIQLLFLYCGSLVDGSKAWEREAPYSDSTGKTFANKKDQAYSYFKKHYRLVFGFHYSPRSNAKKRVRQKAFYVDGLIAKTVLRFEKDFDDLSRFLAEASLEDMILDAVIAEASETLGRVVYDFDIENRIKRWA
ncbi:MAG: hypothetical protein GVY36_17310 [Verrucomicrobia bacterium]|jgi:hypothetical protein|nr:hypothetical protein [Verrucomicrobiota bacterium]